VPNRLLTLDIGEEEWNRRKAAWKSPVTSEGERGYRKLFLDHVTQAGEGADFDFLTSRPYRSKTPV
jgi:dihydroxy-acid dehydratase